MTETQKTNKPFPIVPVIIVILVVGLIGSRFKSKTNDIAKITTKEGQVVVSEEKGLAWPTDLPINIPKYDSGKIKAYSHLEGQTAWTMIISDTNEEYFKNYKEALKKEAWVESSEMMTVVSIVSMKKDGYDINVVWDASSNGALITLSKTLK